MWGPLLIVKEETKGVRIKGETPSFVHKSKKVLRGSKEIREREIWRGRDLE